MKSDVILEEEEELEKSAEDMQLQHDLSKVKLTEKLGEGAYGIVYKGFNSAAGQSECVLPNVLAVKVVQVS